MVMTRSSLSAISHRAPKRFFVLCLLLLFALICIFPTSAAGNNSTVLSSGALLYVFLAAPILEELIFRKFLFSAFCRWIHPIPAALSISAVFASLHPGLEPPICMLSLFLCMIWIRSHSLSACITFHLMYNFLNVLLIHWKSNHPILQILLFLIFLIQMKGASSDV